jgi:glycosyltransferase involved in cell wall biosynthesis
MELPYLSVIIPAYKEEKRIHKVLDHVVAYAKSHTESIEVIVVLDGTPDNTAAVVAEYRDRLPRLQIIDRKENQGKGYTVREGMHAAQGKYRLFADADNSTSFEQVDALLAQMETHDVAIASRYVAGGEQKQKQSLARILGSRVLNSIIRLLVVPGIADTQCGFKLFRANAAEQIFSRAVVNNWSFDFEVLAIARLLGYTIAEVPVVWNDDPHSTLSPVKDGIAMIRAALHVRRNVRNGVYTPTHIK